MILRALILLAATTVGSIATAAMPAGSVKADYDVYRDGLHIVNTRESFEHNDGKFQIVSESDPVGLLAMFIRTRVKAVSSGTVTPAGLRPERFDYGRLDDPGKNVSAIFDWSASLLRMTFDNHTETAAISAGAQDGLSVMYHFMFTHAEQLRDLEFQMSRNGRKVEHYHYQLAGSEQLETKIGKLNTLHLVKKREPDDNGVEIWLAQDHNLFPVKLLILEKDGTKYEQVITRLEIK
jgi:hypothetical protein